MNIQLCQTMTMLTLKVQFKNLWQIEQNVGSHQMCAILIQSYINLTMLCLNTMTILKNAGSHQMCALIINCVHKYNATLKCNTFKQLVHNT